MYMINNMHTRFVLVIVWYCKFFSTLTEYFPLKYVTEILKCFHIFCYVLPPLSLSSLWVFLNRE